MIKDHLDRNEQSSVAFNRSVAEASGKLLMLAEQFGGEITKMTFAEEDEAMTPENIRRSIEAAGKAHWDTSQLPHAIHWIIEFGASGAGAVGAWKFLQKGEIIERLKMLAGLQRITIKSKDLSMEIGGLVTVEEACKQFERLASKGEVQGKARKKPTDDHSGKRSSSLRGGNHTSPTTKRKSGGAVTKTAAKNAVRRKKT